MSRILKISAHCQDRFSASVSGDKELNNDYGPNYVPSDLGIGGGDYIDLEIDLDTGQIINWKKPSDETLKQLFNP